MAKRKSRYWGDEETSKMKRVYADPRTTCLDDVFKAFPDRSEFSVKSKAERLGLCICPNWTHAEDEMLKKHLHKSWKILLRVLLPRDMKSIKRRILYLGLSREERPEGAMSYEEENEIIRDIFQTANTAELTKALPFLSIQQIMSRADSLGVKRT